MLNIMLVLTKIHLMKIKRNLCKSILQFALVPLILLFLEVFYFLIEIFSRRMPYHFNSFNNLEYFHINNRTFFVFNSTSTKFHILTHPIVICEDDTIRTSFVHFLQSNSNQSCQSSRLILNLKNLLITKHTIGMMLDF